LRTARFGTSKRLHHLAGVLNIGGREGEVVAWQLDSTIDRHMEEVGLAGLGYAGRDLLAGGRRDSDSPPSNPCFVDVLLRLKIQVVRRIQQMTYRRNGKPQEDLSNVVHAFRAATSQA
jgi:hypothetical protein